MLQERGNHKYEGAKAWVQGFFSFWCHAYFNGCFSMDIRAHHLLCMRSFQGKGYSEEFVDNFYKVIDELKKNPLVKVVNKPDAICEKCPHNKNGCIKKGPKSELRVRKKEQKKRLRNYAGIANGLIIA